MLANGLFARLGQSVSGRLIEVTSRLNSQFDERPVKRLGSQGSAEIDQSLNNSKIFKWASQEPCHSAPERPVSSVWSAGNKPLMVLSAGCPRWLASWGSIFPILDQIRDQSAPSVSDWVYLANLSPRYHIMFHSLMCGSYVLSLLLSPVRPNRRKEIQNTSFF